MSVAGDAAGAVVEATGAGCAGASGALHGGLIGGAVPFSKASNCSEAMRCSLSSRVGQMRIASAISSSSYVERSVSAISGVASCKAVCGASGIGELIAVHCWPAELPLKKE